jgi:polyhydroxyalkanoate synthase
VERWALDEIRLPGKLVHQIIDWLYGENRFCREKLKIHEKFVGPHGLFTSTLMVINTADQIASLASLIARGSIFCCPSLLPLHVSPLALRNS